MQVGCKMQQVKDLCDPSSRYSAMLRQFGIVEAALIPIPFEFDGQRHQTANSRQGAYGSGDVRRSDSSRLRKRKTNFGGCFTHYGFFPRLSRITISRD